MTRASRVFVLSLGVLTASPATAQVTRRASVHTNGTQASQPAWFPAISADGRYVAFHSMALTLLPDFNDSYDVFVRDLVAGTTEAVSVDSSGTIGNNDSTNPSISADGRYVAFESLATNLIPNDVTGGSDIFVHDRTTHTTERVNLTSTGGTVQQGFSSKGPSISADGRFVSFFSAGPNLVPGDTNGVEDVFVRDRVAGTTERVSVSTTGVEGNSYCTGAAISADGRFVAFTSYASNLVPVDSNNRDVFVRDRLTQTTEKVSVTNGGVGASGHSTLGAISGDGRFVVFWTTASNLVPGDTNQRIDSYLRDRLLGTTQRVSLNSGEGEGNEDTYATSISADGRIVTMYSESVNFVPGDMNYKNDVFVRDVVNGTLERVSLDSEGTQGNGGSSESAITPDGRWIAFSSGASNLVPGDTNGWSDVFVRDREATSFSILCDPVFPVVSCPCSNPPAGPSRGCNNSSGTGGAKLRASGVARLSADSLVFTTSDEKPTALSIVLQGTAYLEFGTPYGAGIRCVYGQLKRLYAKHAVGGSITVPNFGAGDLPVSAQSAAKGDTILPGQSRWYLVYYRDNGVLGGCPPTSNFNATQTGQVSWAP